MGRLLHLAKVAAITFALCFVIPILLFAAFIYIKDGPRPEWHDALNKVHDQVELGMTQGEVSRIIDSSVWPPGKAPFIARDITCRRWTIQSPFEFPASNWILYIDFSDSLVFRVGMGTLDSLDDYPSDARPMKVDARLAAIAEAYETSLRRREALKKEVARIIRHKRPITDVRLSVPFVESGDSSAMTASCVLTIVPNRSLSDSDIQAIRAIIASAFPPLSDNRVTLTDAAGRVLK